MGNTHDTEIARIEADYIHTKWRTTGDYRWGYSNDRGPETWWVYYPSASGGMQSPIDLITEEVTWDPDLQQHPLQICYRVDTTQDVNDDDDDNSSGMNGSSCGRERLVVENTGNAIKINVLNSRSYMTGGPCRSQSYVLNHIDLHWGETDAFGSEHLVNTHSSAAETRTKSLQLEWLSPVGWIMCHRANPSNAQHTSKFLCETSLRTSDLSDNN
ncbi:hypothetical protein HELRODRAFT_175590 [Helobdella robusta]|uniref:Carbonic anhydrase 1 n=1 Tax=Helobdella robusta TaxID=6412 RepID=T1F9E8_HELRO|nr:hypothetical protein HELRODRAFT_175590 [Helobdella robusta]ESO00616.1 hypothetical protein HELRODRAFT_175590 [Helobdella robusta]